MFFVIDLEGNPFRNVELKKIFMNKIYLKEAKLIKMKSKFLIFFLVIIVGMLVIINGCGGGGTGGTLVSGGNQTNISSPGASGALNISFQWPGYSKVACKYISHITNIITVCINAGDSTITRTYSRPDSGMVTDTISDIPSGEVTIKVEATDKNGIVIAKRIIQQTINDGMNSTLNITLGISIESNGITPDNITVPVNTTLIWVNNDTVAHALDNASPPPLGFKDSKGGPFDGTSIAPGETKSYTFNAAYDFYYKDITNPNLTGVVVVKDPPLITMLDTYAILDTEKALRELSIYGDNFWSLQGSSQVYFKSPSGISTAQIVDWSNNKITCIVPADAVSGDLKVNIGGIISNSIVFNVFSFIASDFTPPNPAENPAPPLITLNYAENAGLSYLIMGCNSAGGKGGLWKNQLAGGNLDLGPWTNIAPAVDFICNDTRFAPGGGFMVVGTNIANSARTYLAANFGDPWNQIDFSPLGDMGPIWGSSYDGSKWYVVGSVDVSTIPPSNFQYMFQSNGINPWTIVGGINKTLLDIDLSPTGTDGLAVGQNNAFYAFNGATWSDESGLLPPGCNYSLKKIIGLPNSVAFICGVDMNAPLNGVILRGKQSEGISEVLRSSSDNSNILGMATQYISDEIIHVWAGGTELYYSDDSGNKWSKLNVDSDYKFMDIAAITDKVVYAVGTNALNTRNLIYKITRI